MILSNPVRLNSKAENINQSPLDHSLLALGEFYDKDSATRESLTEVLISGGH